MLERALVPSPPPKITRSVCRLMVLDTFRAEEGSAESLGPVDTLNTREMGNKTLSNLSKRPMTNALKAED